VIGRPTGRALLLGVVVAVVAVVLGAALFVLGSPAEERRRRLDERRVAGLQDLARTIDLYRGDEGALPRDLAALAEWRGAGALDGDPVTGEPYRYRVTGDATYELCATFAASSQERPEARYRRSTGAFWRHPAGDHCYELEAKKPDP
jgi:type II secretory pathway pseudopilin PulG